jgi:hypothetical protein
MVSQDITTPTATLASANDLDCTNTSSLLTATGGTMYNFGSGFSATATMTVTSPNTYMVTVQAANGCTATASVIVLQNITPVTATLASANDLNCTLTSSVLTATGGTMYDFGSGFSATATMTVTSPNTYMVTVQAANGCTATASVMVLQNITTPTATLASANDLNCTNTSSVLTATGGTMYDFGSGFSATATMTVTSPNTYMVTVQAANGCTATASVMVSQDITTPTAGLTSANDLDCTNTSTVLTATGGGTYDFGTGFGATATMTVNAASTYMVTVQGANGCTATASVMVSQDITTPTAGLTSANNIDCINTSTVLTATGGGMYDFGFGFTPTATNTVSAGTTYTVTVQTANGCTATASVMVTGSSTPLVVSLLSSQATIMCDATETATLTASPAGAATYTWTGATSSTETATITAAGIYTVEVTDAGGCTGSATIEVTCTDIEVASADCTTGASVATGVSGNSWVILRTASGRAVAAINPMGNNLGQVTVSPHLYSTPQILTQNNTTSQVFAQRYFDFNVEHQPSIPVGHPQVQVRLYFTNADITAMSNLIVAGGGNPVTRADLYMSHYHGPMTDCDLLNNTGATSLVPFNTLYDVIAPGQANDQSYGASAFYIDANFTSFSEFGAFAVPSVPLPVKLLTFTGRINDKVNDLTWTTASEQNANHFEVERSTNGTEYIGIGARTATNTNTQHVYNFTDSDPATRSYYRLKMIDNDGAFIYSNVVTLIRRNTGLNTIAIYPNPTSSMVKVEYETANATQVTFSITDVLGQELYTIKASAQAGLNVQDLDLTELPSAVYNIIITKEGSERIVRKVVKQ